MVITKKLHELDQVDIHRILQSAGIAQGTGSEKDYVKAKRLLVGSFVLDSTRYEELIQVIVNYVDC